MQDSKLIADINILDTPMGRELLHMKDAKLSIHFEPRAYIDTHYDGDHPSIITFDAHLQPANIKEHA